MCVCVCVSHVFVQELKLRRRQEAMLPSLPDGFVDNFRRLFKL